MKGVNINDKQIPFTDLILEFLKTVETRNTRSLHSLVGQRVGIIRTGCGKALLVGYVDIVEEIEYKDVDAFREDYKRHLVEPGTKYDIKPNGKKYGYVLANPERCEPTPVTAKGIVIRNI